MDAHHVDYFTSIALPAINLGVLIAILTYFLKSKVKDGVSGRHDTIKKELEDVREQLRLAQEKYEDFSAKLKAIDSEIANIQDETRRDAEKLKVEIVADAKKHADKIVVDADRSASTLYADLKDELRAEIGLQVLGRAEKILEEKLTGDEKVRIRREFSVEMEGVR